MSIKKTGIPHRISACRRVPLLKSGERQRLDSRLNATCRGRLRLVMHALRDCARHYKAAVIGGGSSPRRPQYVGYRNAIHCKRASPANPGADPATNGRGFMKSGLPATDGRGLMTGGRRSLFPSDRTGVMSEEISRGSSDLCYNVRGLVTNYGYHFEAR